MLPFLLFASSLTLSCTISSTVREGPDDKPADLAVDEDSVPDELDLEPVDLDTEQSELDEHEPDELEPSDENENDTVDPGDTLVDEELAPKPWVRLIAPTDGAVLENPVRFELEAEGVALVQLFADDWPLSAPFDPAQSSVLEYSFSGVGFERVIRLSGFDATLALLDELSIRITVNDAPLGSSLGEFENTYFYLADESSFEGPPASTLYGPQCEVLAVVSSSFAQAACIEGSARLADGRVINYHSPCSCGGPCSFCWSVMDPARFPWGMGSASNPLEPLRSWAVDTSVISHGSVLYVEEWDGLAIPSLGELGGFVHDGCFRADDVGGGIVGRHVDFFAGNQAMWRELEKLFPTRSRFQVYLDSPRCQP
jgi:3D (Asp-Asp-Asp) domain-containing protein